jgi:hypothetical protein
LQCKGTKERAARESTEINFLTVGNIDTFGFAAVLLVSNRTDFGSTDIVLFKTQFLLRSHNFYVLHSTDGKDLEGNGRILV